MDLIKIKKAENSMDYWKQDALLWWRRYLKNVIMLRKLREQNRQLRRLLSDYTK